MDEELPGKKRDWDFRNFFKELNVGLDMSDFLQIIKGLTVLTVVNNQCIFRSPVENVPDLVRTASSRFQHLK